MNYQSPCVAAVAPFTGVLTGSNGHYRKTIQDLAGIYFDQNSFEELRNARGPELAYEVYEYRPNTNQGDLIFGTSILLPGKVGNEYFMTRGHLHALSDRPEIYYCQGGHGVMLMENLRGETSVAELKPNEIVYVPPHWIHRSVNVGSAPFITLFCYPADAGQDYDIIARSGGMKSLIVDDLAGGWREESNSRYRPRSLDYDPA
jgi:glucose-6-phosphate isomerase, archaeal